MKTGIELIAEQEEPSLSNKQSVDEATAEIERNILLIELDLDIDLILTGGIARTLTPIRLLTILINFMTMEAGMHPILHIGLMLNFQKK